MNSDAVVRYVAVALGVVLALGPFVSHLRRWAEAAWQVAQKHIGMLARVAAAAVCIGFGAGLIKVPPLPATTAVAWPEIEAPSDTMKAVVAPVASVLKNAPTGDRLLWAQLWSKAALVVAGDVVSTEVVFTDTRSLRAFTALALEIGWRRIGGNEPGKLAGLREATEAAFSSVLGKDVVPVTADLREKYASLCRALAWASLPPRG